MKANIESFPLITIILTTYNRCNLLPQAVHSVLNSSYQYFELLIIDDASNDCTTEIVSDFKDHRITYIRMEENGGVLRARNCGFDLAKGDCITILDDDDELLPGALEAVATEFRRACKEDIDILWFDCVDAEIGKISGSMPENSGIIKFEDYVCGKIEGDFWLVFSKRSLHKHRFYEELRAHESLLWLKIHKNHSARHISIVVCKKYRQHGGERLCDLNVRLKQLNETTLAFRYYLRDFGDDLRRICPMTYGFRLAYLGLHEMMIGDISSGRQSILRSLKYWFSMKYLLLALLSWFVGSKEIIALYRRIEELSDKN